jgi:hypothetical protein
VFGSGAEEEGGRAGERLWRSKGVVMAEVRRAA